MRFTLYETDGICHVKEVTPSSSVIFPLAVSKQTVVELLIEMLSNPEQRDAASGPIRVERMRDGLRLAVGAGTFTVPYAFIFPLVMEA